MEVQGFQVEPDLDRSEDCKRLKLDGRYLLEIGPSSIHLKKCQDGILTAEWEYPCLKEFGFSGSTFFFYCGRQCFTGAGYFVFRSEEGSDIISLLKSATQNLRAKQLSDKSGLVSIGKDKKDIKNEDTKLSKKEAKRIKQLEKDAEKKRKKEQKLKREQDKKYRSKVKSEPPSYSISETSHPSEDIYANEDEPSISSVQRTVAKQPKRSPILVLLKSAFALKNTSDSPLTVSKTAQPASRPVLSASKSAPLSASLSKLSSSLSSLSSPAPASEQTASEYQAPWGNLPGLPGSSSGSRQSDDVMDGLGDVYASAAPRDDQRPIPTSWSYEDHEETYTVAPALPPKVFVQQDDGSVYEVLGAEQQQQQQQPPEYGAHHVYGMASATCLPGPAPDANNVYSN